MLRTIQIGKRRWLAGLAWSSFEDAPSNVELKEDAQRLKASWACVRIGEKVIQAGFCAPLPGAKKPVKLFSLAAMLADSREQPWLGTFKIEEGVWWYIAVRDGHAILPDGDVIGGQDEILAARERHSGYTDWKYIEGDINLLEELINEVEAKPTPIRSLSGQVIPAAPLLACSAVLLGLLGGGYWWYHNQQSQALERAVAMAKARAQLLAGQPPVVAPSPLLTTPQPNEWLEACGSVILALPLSQNGWTLEQISCASMSVIVHWTRRDGATVATKPTGALSQDGESIEQAIPLDGMILSGRNDAVELPTAKLALLSWVQAASFELTFNTIAPVTALPGAESNNQNTQAPQPQISFTLKMPISPFSLDMTSIPGLRFTTLKSTDKGWTLEGMLYGR